jgi:hypothetical protein
VSHIDFAINGQYLAAISEFHVPGFRWRHPEMGNVRTGGV